MKTNSILELYKTIQSDGLKAGTPVILVRLSNCTHRCYFGDRGWCENWYSSIHPDKNQYSVDDFEKYIYKFPQITHVLFTGGSPTLHPELLNQLNNIAKDRKMYTILETEGSHFIATDKPFDLIAISPKLSNSIPELGVKTPQGIKVTQEMIDIHNKFRLNIREWKKMVNYHCNYYFKFSVRNERDISEIKHTLTQYSSPFVYKRNIHSSKIYISPLINDIENEEYQEVMRLAVENGWVFTAKLSSSINYC